MCGRYSLAKDAKLLADEFPGFEVIARLAARYNIAPAQPIVIYKGCRPTAMDIVQWGLVPPWAEDPAIGSGMINARAETAAVKPAFRAAFHRKRCLVPADGWYEWGAIPGQKHRHPVWFHRRDGRPFSFAGLWEEWHDREGGLLMTATILTVPANALCRPFHDRMPAILPPESRAAWLSDETTRTSDLQALLRPEPGGEFAVRRVSTHVNAVRNDDPACIAEAPAPPQQTDLFEP